MIDPTNLLSDAIARSEARRLSAVATKPFHVHVMTSHFEMMRGAKPRGRGLWIFRIGKTEYLAKNAEGRTSMTYGEAKKLAVAEAQKTGHSLIQVLS